MESIINIIYTTFYVIALNSVQVLCALSKDAEYGSMPVLFHLDDYDQCMLLGPDAFYCMATFQLRPDNLSNPSEIWKIVERISSKPSNYRHDLLRHGVCVPETCRNITGDAEIAAKLTQCYNRKYNHMGIQVEVVKIHCEGTESPYPIDAYDILVAVVVIAYLIFIAFASFYEGTARYKSKEDYAKIIGTRTGKLISAFSLPKNWSRLRTVKLADPSTKSLRCIQGIRFYNMVCVILAHTVMVSLASPVSNPLYAETMTKETLNMLLANGGNAVQTFFLISGWLLSYYFFLEFDGKRKITLLHLLLSFVIRYIRLTPALAITVAFHSTWLVHLGRGPFWDELVGAEHRNCRKNWWTNLLYINNYVNKQHMCLEQSWYLAADLQLFCASLFVVFLMLKYQNRIALILITVLSVGLLIPFLVAYVNSYDIIVRMYPEPMYNMLLLVPHWHVMYTATHSNIAGYMLGVTFGYIFYKRGVKPVTSKFQVFLWWLLTFGMCLFVTLIGGIMYRDNYEYTRLESAAYWSFGRNIFALGMAIGIFGLTQKVGWVVLWSCQLSVLQVLGRLTFSAYLVHNGLMKFMKGYQRNPAYLSNYQIFHTMLGDLAAAYILATVLCLVVEMPFSALQKIVLQSFKKNQHEPNTLMKEQT